MTEQNNNKLIFKQPIIIKIYSLYSAEAFGLNSILNCNTCFVFNYLQITLKPTIPSFLTSHIDLYLYGF